VSIAAAVLLVAGLVVSSSAQATVAPGASTAHPFSAPIWYPLRDAGDSDCVHSNPGCAGIHPVWEMDIGTTNDGSNSHPIYAMGAGILHIGSTNTACGPGTGGRGEFVWIDHGGGVISVYGHLSKIIAKSGEYVTPKTEIALMGNSGYTGCKKNPKIRYLYVAVQHGGRGGAYVQITHLYACNRSANARENWPQAVTSASTWNTLARGVHLPATSSNRGCIPSAATTPSTPTGVKAHHAGSGKLTVTWPAPPASAKVTSVTVAVEYRYKNASGHYAYASPRYTSVAASKRSLTYTGLDHGRFYKYQVNYLNSTGASRPNAWVGAYAP
jgi:Peptidase family M23/Fibronectin type III domain